jgi:hypothetical protein
VDPGLRRGDGMVKRAGSTLATVIALKSAIHASFRMRLR